MGQSASDLGGKVLTSESDGQGASVDTSACGELGQNLHKYCSHTHFTVAPLSFCHEGVDGGSQPFGHECLEVLFMIGVVFLWESRWYPAMP